jgi:hypothetical protein
MWPPTAYFRQNILCHAVQGRSLSSKLVKLPSPHSSTQAAALCTLTGLQAFVSAPSFCFGSKLLCWRRKYKKKKMSSTNRKQQTFKDPWA